MTVIDDYIASLEGAEKTTVGHMYMLAREMVPEASEELSYSMPTVKHKGKSVVAIIANKGFLSLYPFGNIEDLEVNLSGFEGTKGSIHFTADKPLPDDLVRQIITARLRQIG